ncbi:Fatty acyl-CoA reductase 2 [Hibiscus syriacus]|uniref:Fatty acyl-CoA reductase n=1 Tax=Hibiscus syriacus TaxID=106335 RepID=A0A6A2YMS1_HIBSY|nr:Fatty acyl-CoA reductase 2 [Hibiscus syriacus]
MVDLLSLLETTTTTINDCNLAHCLGTCSAVRRRSRIVKGADSGRESLKVLIAVRRLWMPGALIMSSPNPNMNTQADLIAVKDLVPHGGTTSLVELQEGIGIVKFLRGKEFFISGSTGFLARVLIEKISRTVPDIGKIFVLVKAKTKEAAMDRLKTEGMFDSDLGLDADVSDSITKRVDIIVNSAANTTFDERACRLIGFAQKCRKLELLLQVSTGKRGRVMEKAFDMPRSVPEFDIEEEFVLARGTEEGCDESEVAQKMKELGLERRRVPADMVVNATLAAIARHGMTPKPDINIYHIASSVVNPLVFQDLASMLYEQLSTTTRDTMHRTGFAASRSGKSSQKLKAVRCKSVGQAKYLANIYEPYTFYGGRFDNSNTMRLTEKMSEEEKMSFGFDAESIEWKDYTKNVHIPGLRRHVMKGRGIRSSPVS